MEKNLKKASEETLREVRGGSDGRLPFDVRVNLLDKGIHCLIPNEDLKNDLFGIDIKFPQCPADKS